MLKPKCRVCGIIDLWSRLEAFVRAGFWGNSRAEFCYRNFVVCAEISLQACIRTCMLTEY